MRLHPAWDIYREWHILAAEERIAKGQKAWWNDFVCSVMMEWARVAMVLPPPLVSDSSSEEPDPEHSDTEENDQWEGVAMRRFLAEWPGAMMALASSHRRSLHHRQFFMRPATNSLTADFMDIAQGMRRQQESTGTASS